MAAPMPQAPAQMGIQEQQYSPTTSGYQASQATPQQDNPYKEAFNKVVGLLSSPVQFPFQGQQSTQSQAIDPASYGSQQTTQYSNPAAQISTPGISNNPASFNNSSQISQQALTTDQLRANGVSDASLQVIDHFGADAPAVLNNYACTVEDALINTSAKLDEGVKILRDMTKEHKAYEKILTNPDVLADYTTKFFGPKGPYPVQAQNRAPVAPRGAVPAAAPTRPAQARPTAPSRPQMPAPPQPQAQGNPKESLLT
jgi:hypothetical protein